MVLENQSFPLLQLSLGAGKSLLMRMENKFTKAGGWEGLEGDQNPALGSLGLLEIGLFAWGWCPLGDLGGATRTHIHHCSSLVGQSATRFSSERPCPAVPGRASSHSQAQRASPAGVCVPGTASTQLG